MWLSSTPLPSSVLALSTTAHLALAALRNHRQVGPGAISLLALFSLAFASTPWLYPSVPGLGIGLGLHAVWFLICEQFASPAVAKRAAGGPAPARPSAPPTRPAPVRPSGFTPVPVIAVLDEAPDIRTFRFARPDGFDFTAGQFLAVRVRIDGREHVRCYSISSAPEARGYLEISVKRQGLVSSTLHATVRPGTQVHLKAPAGAFRYPSADDRPIVLLAGGVGITPLISMLRHAVQTEPQRSVTLVYSAQTEEQLAFRDEIRLLARRHPHLSVFFAASRGSGLSDVYPGRIDDALLNAAIPDAAHTIAMICGPQPMIDRMRELLLARGMPPAQVRAEAFEAAVAVAASAADGHAPAPAAGESAHDVTCERSRRTVRVAAGQSLLEAAEAAGVAIESLCRSGVCGTCRTRVVSGEMRCASSMLDDADRQSGFVLACVSHPHTNCVIEA
jgi:ferredoxin-NADP reductase